MAVVNVRNLPDEVRDRLRVRAAKAGRSMEAEVRAILAAACAEEHDQNAGDLPGWVERLYHGQKPGGVVADLIAERRREARRERRPERSRRRQRK